jgi:hypothetical protein
VNYSHLLSPIGPYNYYDSNELWEEILLLVDNY